MNTDSQRHPSRIQRKARIASVVLLALLAPLATRSAYASRSNPGDPKTSEAETPAEPADRVEDGDAAHTQVADQLDPPSLDGAPQSPVETSGEMAMKTSRRPKSRSSTTSAKGTTSGDRSSNDSGLEAPKQKRRAGVLEGADAEAPAAAPIAKQFAGAKTLPPKVALKNDARCEMRMPAYEHTVVEGEHLGTIAGRYGVLVKDILAINPAISDANKIRIGQTIVVCPEIAPKELMRIEHTLAAGETLSHVALRYGASVDELVGFQGGKISDPNKVRAGTVLVVWTQGEAVAGYRSDEEIESEAPPPPKTEAGRRWIQMSSGSGWSLKRPELAYGTKATIDHMTHALERYAKKAGKSPAVQIGDISRSGGGRLYPHLSHRHGVDVDIGFVMKGDQSGAKSFRSAVEHPESIDVHRTWLLLESILVSGHVRYVFLDYEVQQQLYDHAVELGVPKSQLDNWFQYPRGRGRNHGIVRHWKHHRGHLHVRFRET